LGVVLGVVLCWVCVCVLNAKFVELKKHHSIRLVPLSTGTQIDTHPNILL